MNYEKHIVGLKEGSYNDFKFLYEQFSGNLYGFAFSLVRSESLAKDIVQETFMKVWINRETIQPGLSFKSYLFKISRNLIIDEFRKQMSNPVFENYLDYCDELQTSHHEIEQQIDFDLFILRLEEAKKKLTLRQREIFEMSKEQGLSSSKIAEELGISEQTIYNQLSTVMRILRKEIGGSLLLLLTLFFD
ncbi:RNA polymerase sigma factor [Bacteroides sp. 51]|uniref:RNA polymerase sigma factor n=1 Tax=Bacteroides sp. 51 TaxID=2302938 RepID=UPI0013D70739|nr:sigma-70 family RNA polymerase sigma factor [Bacteroides sp. 51]NDV81898.1 sigma-70 family RNA polymerase sigma factor [Bacteroides sp. 51]